MRKNGLNRVNSITLLLLSLVTDSLVNAEERQVLSGNDSKLVIVTIDGLRWQEMFGGVDEKLLKAENFVNNIEATTAEFWAQDKQTRRNRLMPFFTQVIDREGALIGDRDKSESITVANEYYFSYPGYLEIYSGKIDRAITSNDKVENDTTNILERLQERYQYPNRIGVFASWDVFPYILRRGQNELFINSGFEPLDAITANIHREEAKTAIDLVNNLFANTPSPWEAVRLDAFTHAYAMLYLKEVKPRVLAISYGDTDDFAHQGKYDAYLRAAQRTDRFIKELWEYLQSDPFYKNKTHLLITTDHGRGGNTVDWRHHASKTAIQGYMNGLAKYPEGIIGSEHIWIGAIGPNIKPLQNRLTKPIQLIQFAPSALILLGECELAEGLQEPIYEIMETKPCQ